MFHLLDAALVEREVPFQASHSYLVELMSLLERRSLGELVGPLSSIFHSGRWQRLSDQLSIEL
jgi:hypothetical protein